MPLTNVLKKSLARQSTQSGISRWAPLGLILSMTACTSSNVASRLQPFVVGIGPQQYSGAFDAAGQAFTKELGVHSLRLAFNHGDADFGVNWAAQNGIGVLYMLGYGVGCDARTVSGRQCYADRSAGLAQKYGNKVQYYEVWNEWNGIFGPFGGWRENQAIPAVAAYTDLLCQTYKAVKAVQPNAKVVGGVTAGTGTSFIRNMLDGGAGNCMDVVSVHPYPFSEHSEFNVPYNSSATVMANKFIGASVKRCVNKFRRPF